MLAYTYTTTCAHTYTHLFMYTYIHLELLSIATFKWSFALLIFFEKKLYFKTRKLTIIFWSIKQS
jgi:hypothetical protein